MMRPIQRVLNVALFLAVAMPVPLTARAGLFGGGVGGATEITQILNHVELVASVAKQSQMVGEQVASRLVQLQQYDTMLRHLQRADAAALAQSLAPYQAQHTGLETLASSVGAMRQASLQVQRVMDGRLGEASAMNLDFQTYMTQEMALASRRGGAYRRRMDQDLAAMDELALRAHNLRTVAAQTQDVSGSVQGLQQLARLSSITAGELLDIKSALLAQNAEQNNEAARRALSQAQRAGAAAQAAQQSAARRERNAAARFTLAAPWAEEGGR